jgi:hypothetical protein
MDVVLPAPMQAPREMPSLLRVMVVAVLVLNLLDAVLTLVWVHAGIAEEANLLLAHVLEHSSVGFMMVKMGLVSLGVLLLWQQRERLLARAGFAIALFAYGFLLVYHLAIAAATLEDFLV